MDTNTIQSNEKANVTAGVMKRLFQVFGNLLVVAAILFASSGDLGWVYIAVGVAVLTINALVILPTTPELAVERSRVAENTKGWDRVAVVLIFISGAGIFLVAGLDEHFSWSPQLATAIHIAALVAVIMAQAVFIWAMASNRFFAKTVRIQEERGHTVATTGPYRFVRHPFYVGTIIFSLAVPVSLGSPWALISGGLAALLFVVKTALEDRMLQEGLPGYGEYAQRTRYRLLPGVW